MNTSSALNSRHSKPSTASFCNYQADQQQQPMTISKFKGNSPLPTLPAPITSSNTSHTISFSSSSPTDSSSSPTTSLIDGYSTPKAKNQTQNQKMASKRKRLHLDDKNVPSVITPTPTKRKASNNFLRKGQWTSTEERLTRLLIEAFEEGSLPIYTGIRLRGYLAVQLQCDPMRVSKKLCAGTIDGKKVPKNYGQKKFKLRKKGYWDTDEARSQMAQLERLTRALWTEAQLRKPSFLTLSSTCNLNKRQGSPSIVPARNYSPSSTPKTKKQKVFPIIYLNLYKPKRYSVGEESSGSEPASSSKDSESESEPVKLDGESLQAAYDLLTLCSPRGSASKSRGKRGRCKKDVAKKGVISEDIVREEGCNEDKRMKTIRARRTMVKTSQRSTD